MLCVPLVLGNRGKEAAILFVMNDRPVLEALGSIRKNPGHRLTLCADIPRPGPLEANQNKSLAPKENLCCTPICASGCKRSTDSAS